MKNRQLLWSGSNSKNAGPASGTRRARESSRDEASGLPESGDSLFRFPLYSDIDKPAIGDLLELALEPVPYSGLKNSKLLKPLPIVPERGGDEAVGGAKPATGVAQPAATEEEPLRETVPAPEVSLFGQGASEHRVGHRLPVLIVGAILIILAALIFYYTVRNPAGGAALPTQGSHFLVWGIQPEKPVAETACPQRRPIARVSEIHGQA